MDESRRRALLDADRRHVWHPYAAPEPVERPLVVERAEGVRLHLADGRALIDGMSSWWAAIHGYAHPALDAAARDQLGRMAHVMFGGLTHEPAVSLCERLVAVTPPGLERVFLCDSGSVGVEVAIKLAIQYRHARGEARRSRLLTVRGGYHGDTFGAMAVCDPVTGMHQLFRGVLPQHLFAPVPRTPFGGTWDPRDVAELERLAATHADELAAVILEPIVQGAGGMRFYHPRYLEAVRALCDEHRLLLIADEIATGFGRSGRLFACEHAAVAPDILCVGKALTGGYATLAATLTTDEVANTIGQSAPGGRSAPGVFMHGPTFMGNPLACAIAGASVETLLASPWQERVAAIDAQLRRELAPIRGLPGVADVRVLGAIGVVEMTAPLDPVAARATLVDAGVWLRPFGRLLYTMPPFVIEPPDLTRVTGAMHAVVAAHGGDG